MENSNDETPEKDNSGEKSTQLDPSRPILASLRGQRRSRRSLLRITLLCVGLGILGLAIFFVLKPENEEPPQMPEERMERRIAAPLEKEGEPVFPEAIGEKARGKEWGRPVEPEGKKPEIEEKEEEKPQIAMVEEPKDQVVPGGKLSTGGYTVNVGSFREEAKAERLMNALKEKGYEVFVIEAAIRHRGTWYRVSVGRFATREEAQAFAQALKEKEAIEYFVRELREAKR